MEHVHCTEGLSLAPSLSIGTTVTSSATVNVYGAWTTLVASIAADRYLTSVVIRAVALSNPPAYIQIAIATGAVSSEVELAVIKVPVIAVDVAAIAYLNPPLRVSAGQRVSVRIADGLSSALAYSITLHHINVSSINSPILSEVDSPDGNVVADGANSASSFKTNLTQSANSHWNFAFLKFKTGTLTGQVRKVTGYNGSTKFITCDTFTAPPAANDAFDIINR